MSIMSLHFRSIEYFSLTLDEKKNYPTQAMSIMLLQALTFVENLKKCVEDNKKYTKKRRKLIYIYIHIYTHTHTMK